MNARKAVLGSLLLLSLAPLGRANPQQGSKRATPLVVWLDGAISDGNVALTKKLLKHHALVNSKNALGQTPLSLLQRGTVEQQLIIAKLLIQHGADANFGESSAAMTPFMSLVFAGAAPRLLTYMLHSGAHLNATDRDGMTALHLAVMVGKPENVQLLVTAGAQVLARTRSDYVDHYPWGMQPNWKDSGVTPFVELGTHWSPAIAKILISAGASENVADDNGWTALHYAVYNEDLEAIRGLISLGVDPNASSTEGFRPMHLAFSITFASPKISVIQELVKAGGSLQLKNKLGQTPAELLRSDAAPLMKWAASEGIDTTELRRATLDKWNAILAKYDSKHPPLVPPEPMIDGSGIHYAPVEFQDFTVPRTIKLIDGLAVLDLDFSNVPSKVRSIRMDKLLMNNLAPSEKIPLRIDISKLKNRHLLVTFPSQAAEHPYLTIKYTVTHSNGTLYSGSEESSPSDLVTWLNQPTK